MTFEIELGRMKAKLKVSPETVRTAMEVVRIAMEMGFFSILLG